MPATRLKIFISSVQKEFEDVRRDLKAFLLGDAALRLFIQDVFLFEKLPAADQRADETYLNAVEQSDIYLGLFGDQYGYEDESGISPTEHEYDHAGKHQKERFIYVWGEKDENRHPKMKKLIAKASQELRRRRVENISALNSEVYASLVDYLEKKGALRIPPFDTAACDGSSLKHLTRKRIDWFIETARRERRFPLKPKTTTKALLTHLNLLEDGQPTNAAILLFGNNPQKFHRTAETKCIHCHGTAYRRPFASQQIFTGDLFEQVDQARDFVLAKINRSVGTRADSITAPAVYELPPDAVGEAIVNAVAHRDYHSNGSVEVRLFADRLEVWNPGTLPGALTLESLRTDHPSLPHNPLIAEPLYLTRYIEKAGSGFQMMIEQCREAGLPEPDIVQRDGSLVVTIWRDWLTPEVVATLSLNDRQQQVLSHLKTTERIGNTEYQTLLGVSKRTAHRDLKGLVEKGILKKIGTTGKGVAYVLHKGAIKGPKGPSIASVAKGATKGPKGP
jgi:predicted HTH transcriptional regulator